jgi:hypothetical protein
MTARDLAEALRGLVAAHENLSATAARVANWAALGKGSKTQAVVPLIRANADSFEAQRSAVRTLADYDRAEAEPTQRDELSTVETILLSRKGTK